MPLVAKYSEFTSEAQTLMESAYQAIVNDMADPEKILKDTAEQLKNNSGLELSKIIK